MEIWLLAALSSPDSTSWSFRKRDSSSVHRPNFLEGMRLTLGQCLGLSPSVEHLRAPGTMQTLLYPQYYLIFMTIPVNYWIGWSLVASPLTILPSPFLVMSRFSMGETGTPPLLAKLLKDDRFPLSDAGRALDCFKLSRDTHLPGLSWDLLVCSSF